MRVLHTRTSPHLELGAPNRGHRVQVGIYNIGLPVVAAIISPHVIHGCSSEVPVVGSPNNQRLILLDMLICRKVE